MISIKDKILPQIENIIVVMMENRSCDNITGWLYDKEKHLVKKMIKPEESKPDHYDGLAFGNYSNPFVKENRVDTIPVSYKADNDGVPNTIPHEEFQFITKQLYGEKVPSYGDIAPMDGFVNSYASRGGNPHEIMQCYSPEQLPVINEIARNGAISDRWFASVPTQTLPNRAFLHCGTSQGNVNNIDSLIFNAKTIFNVLSEHNVSWRVYSDSGILPSLARSTLSQLWGSSYSRNFLGFEQFTEDAGKGNLPRYSFIEPMFVFTAQLMLRSQSRVNSMHPPTSVLSGENFLALVYNAVFGGPNWDKSVLIITYDEHGGIYDHVSPPWGAATPDEESNPGKQGFYFDRFGVRIPTIVSSAWVDESVVFRSFGTPYDHTSIIATILDWQGIPRSELPSKRVKAAENIASIFDRKKPRDVISNIDITKKLLAEKPEKENKDREISGLEKGMARAYTAYNCMRKGEEVDTDNICCKVDELKTFGDLCIYLDEEIKN
ncbi:MAG: phosphoesterase [Rickettsiaceae bacterium H1]|nr:phosphoesterase [Rickettsiaceae bacterium H1]